MTTDIRLNALIRALDERLKTVSIDDVELSVRTYKALKDCGVRTLHEAQMALINRQLHKQRGAFVADPAVLNGREGEDLFTVAEATGTGVSMAVTPADVLVLATLSSDGNCVVLHTDVTGASDNTYTFEPSVSRPCLAASEAP